MKEETLKLDKYFKVADMWFGLGFFEERTFESISCLPVLLSRTLL